MFAVLCFEISNISDYFNIHIKEITEKPDTVLCRSKKRYQAKETSKGPASVVSALTVGTMLSLR